MTVCRQALNDRVTAGSTRLHDVVASSDECFETVDRMERKPDDPTTGPFAVAMLRLACCSGCGGPAIRIRYEQPRYTRELALFELHGMIQDLRRIRQD